MLRPTPGDPWGFEQHHWNTGAKENQQLNPGGPSNRQKSSGPNELNYTVTSKRTKQYSAFWRNSRNHFNCSMVLAAPLQHGAESTRAFGLLPSALETTISHQWWLGCHRYRPVSYTSTGRWPLVTIETNSHRCW